MTTSPTSIGEMDLEDQIGGLASSPQPHLSRDIVGSLGGGIGDLGRDHHYLGSSRVDMGSWARTGRGCTLHSGGCTARGLGPARVEVLLGRRKAVGVKKGRESTLKSAFHSTMYIQSQSTVGFRAWRPILPKPT